MNSIECSTSSATTAMPIGIIRIVGVIVVVVIRVFVKPFVLQKKMSSTNKKIRNYGHLKAISSEDMHTLVYEYLQRHGYEDTCTRMIAEHGIKSKHSSLNFTMCHGEPSMSSQRQKRQGTCEHDERELW